MGQRYKIGTRGSQLALWQAEFVKWLLREQWPDDEFEIVTIKSSGDDLSIDISASGGKGLYVKELEHALVEKQVDICVHCLKDLPVQLPNGCELAAVIERGEVRDVLISRDKKSLSDFTDSMRIGTSSLRRRSQLRAQGIKSEIVNIRGNVDSRIRKVQAGEVDGIILAAAGVLRLGLENQITEYLDYLQYIPAPGQGAIAIECRSEDEQLRMKLRKIHDEESEQAVKAERVFLEAMGANCTLPLGALCIIEQFQMRLYTYVADVNAETVLMESSVGPVGHPEKLGKKLSERLMAQGAQRILGQLEVL